MPCTVIGIKIEGPGRTAAAGGIGDVDVGEAVAAHQLHRGRAQALRQLAEGLQLRQDLRRHHRRVHRCRRQLALRAHRCAMPRCAMPCYAVLGLSSKGAVPPHQISLLHLRHVPCRPGPRWPWCPDAACAVPQMQPRSGAGGNAHGGFRAEHKHGMHCVSEMVWDA